MCLAVPGKIIEAGEHDAVVDLHGNRLRIVTALTPGVRTGEWVLVHAGFSIATIPERDALETWDYLTGVDPDTVLDEAGGERPGGAA